MVPTLLGEVSLFVWFGFDQRSKHVVNSTQTMQLNTNKQEQQQLKYFLGPLAADQQLKQEVRLPK